MLRLCRGVELGCGPGKDAAYLASRGFDVTAIDIVPTALKQTEKKAGTAGVKVRWLQADVLNPPKLEPLDLIYDRGCYHRIRGLHHGVPWHPEALAGDLSGAFRVKQRRPWRSPNALRLATSRLRPVHRDHHGQRHDENRFQRKKGCPRLTGATLFNKWRGQDSNLRPRGYEPRELPGCSTPRQVGRERSSHRP
jgi:SAM-dependent methyltransferase